MKIKYADQVCFHTLATTGGAGVVNDHEEITEFAALDSTDAILLSKVSLANPAQVQAKAALTEFSFVWGVSGKAFTLTPTLLDQELLQGVVVRAGGLVAEGFYFMGAHQDTIDFNHTSSICYAGVRKRYAARHVYVGASAKNMEASSIILRIQYDVVTLTSAEMAILFSLLVS